MCKTPYTMKTKYEEYTDSDLVTLIYQKDTNAENEFCRRYRKTIITHMSQMFPGLHQHLEDIAHDTLLGALLCLRRGGYINNGNKLYTWVCAIAKNICRNKSSRKEECIDTSTEYFARNGPIDTAQRPDVLLIKKERNRFARNISKSLCPTKMQAVNSIVFDQKKIAEYAKSSNIDITVAKRRYFSGIESLRNKYSHLKAEFSVS